MKLSNAMILATSLMMVAACDGGGDKGGAKSGSSAAKGGDTTAAADVPTEEDFEDEAEKAVTADSLDAEVAKLEKEIESGD
jgi:hypothetical protein